MEVEVVCSLIAAGGVVVSAMFSWLISHSTINKEIKKTQMTWKREDVISSDDEFAKMSAEVAKYLQSGSITLKQEAIAEVAFVRSKESGELASKLDALYSTIESGNLSASDDCLSAVLEEKRKRKRKAQSPQTNT